MPRRLHNALFDCSIARSGCGVIASLLLEHAAKVQIVGLWHGASIPGSGQGKMKFVDCLGEAGKALPTLLRVQGQGKFIFSFCPKGTCHLPEGIYLFTD